MNSGSRIETNFGILGKIVMIFRNISHFLIIINKNNPIFTVFRVILDNKKSEKRNLFWEFTQKKIKNL